MRKGRTKCRISIETEKTRAVSVGAEERSGGSGAERLPNDGRSVEKTAGGRVGGGRWLGWSRSEMER